LYEHVNRRKDITMEIGIIGAGSVAQAFARHALKVGHTIKISNSRGPSTLGETVQTLGSGVTAVTKEEAAASEIVVLAVPWDDVVGVLTHLPPWQHQILIDATNPFHGRAGTFTPADVHGLSTSQFVAQLAPGAKVVKAINHMLVANFEAGGDVNGAKRVAFVSADDADAKTTVGALLRTFGFAVIDLGNLRDGGLIQQAGGPLAGLDILQRL
jgi:8-hydroxy-5-deazaflavin:NADPH oxidoreductase